MAEKRNDLLLDQPPSKPSLLDSLLLLPRGKGDAAATRKRRSTAANEDSERRPLTAALPPSQVLGKVKDFLGLMAKANEELELEAQNGCLAKYDIEALSGNEKEYIQMDLLLGITDLHTEEAISAAEAAMTSSHRPVMTTHSSNSDTEDDSDDIDDRNSDEEATYHSEKFSLKRDKPVEKSKANKKPKIIVLDHCSN